MTASLKGIRVLEMAQIMAGPTCGLLLADMKSGNVVQAGICKINKFYGKLR